MTAQNKLVTSLSCAKNVIAVLHSIVWFTCLSIGLDQLSFNKAAKLCLFHFSLFWSVTETLANCFSCAYTAFFDTSEVSHSFAKWLTIKTLGSRLGFAVPKQGTDQRQRQPWSVGLIEMGFLHSAMTNFSAIFNLLSPKRHGHLRGFAMLQLHAVMMQLSDQPHSLSPLHFEVSWIASIVMIGQRLQFLIASCTSLPLSNLFSWILQLDFLALQHRLPHLALKSHRFHRSAEYL